MADPEAVAVARAFLERSGGAGVVVTLGSFLGLVHGELPADEAAEVLAARVSAPVTG